MTRIRRSGFTLNEVLISLVILSIIGAAFTKIITYQTRYFAHETSLRSARSVARAANNILLSDLRALQDSGAVDSVSADGKTVRILVPYRFGLVCATNSSITTVSLLPTDSATIAMSAYKGFAWLNGTGKYTYNFPSNPTGSDIPVTSPTPALCTGAGSGQAQIRSVSILTRTGDIVDLKTSGSSGAITGAPVFLFQKITYSFRQSAAYSNANGLWRHVEGGRDEELVAPFDPVAARFRFYQRGDDTSRVTPPDVALIRGLELVLTAWSPIRSSNTAGMPMEKVVTSVFFKNVRKY
jgi:prepilin-type N-terminal cleavage/methylation domain-containing protein